MLTAKNIHKKYGDLTVLKGVDLTINKGEIVSFVGASGAGKSTLLHILGTLDRPDKGTVTIDGDDITKYKQRKLSSFRNLHIGFVFQQHHLLPEFSAIENISMPALISGMSKSKAEKKANELLDFLQLKERGSHRPSELS